MENVSYGDWKVVAICKNCNHSVGEVSFGDSWFANESYPCCPKCGAYKPFVSKTCREVYTRVKGWWIFEDTITSIEFKH